MIKKLIYKIQNKELLIYIKWKTKKFQKNPFLETRLNILKSQLNKSKENPKKYLDLKFKILKTDKSDINEHMQTLYEYAKKSETIFETGVRGVVSSWALLKGLHENSSNEKKIFLNDIEKCDIEEIEYLAKNLDICFKYEWINNLDIKINEKYDLVFIDTWHVYGQLIRELHKFSQICNKFIILHDTTVDGEVGESVRNNWDIQEQAKETGYTVEEIYKGLWPAVEDFLNSNNEWVLEKRYTNCNGLTILKRK
jgi:hypothetical protein